MMKETYILSGLKPNYIVLELLGVQMVLLVMVVTPKATELHLLQRLLIRN